MGKLVQNAAIDRKTRRWLFDVVAWLVGVAMAAALIAEAAAGGRSIAASASAAWTSESGTSLYPAERDARWHTEGKRHGKD